ncbi:MAG: DUF2510 domain-containing protein [Actinomycetota bacterium]
MTDVPAGWYDDPEHPDQYRYWDGTDWSDHRAPKKPPPAPSSEAGSMVSEGWNLIVQNWLPVLLVGVAAVVATIAALVTLAIQGSSALDPGFFEIVERVSEPGFDPANNASDEAFIESIEFNPSTGFWVTVGLSAILWFIAQGFFLGVIQIHLATAALQRPFTLGESFGLAFRRLPRWIGIYLLWMLVYALLLGFVGFVIFLGTLLPVLFLLIIPGLIALVVFGYPYVWMATTSLVLGRPSDPPFRTIIGLIRVKGWSAVAWPVFLVNLLFVGANFVAGFLQVIPVLGQIVALVAQLFLYAIPAALNIPIWRMMDGPIAEEISGEAPTT